MLKPAELPRFPGLAVLLSFLLVSQLLPGQPGPPPDQLKIIVIDEKDMPIDNITQRTAREVIVEVDDENHKPVAGALLVFSLPARGASGTFVNGGNMLSVVTNPEGQATVTFQPNNIQGPFRMRVNTTYQGKTGHLEINQTNPNQPGPKQHGHSHTLLIGVLAAAAAGIGFGVYKGTGGGGPATTITPGIGVVGPPR